MEIVDDSQPVLGDSQPNEPQPEPSESQLVPNDPRPDDPNTSDEEGDRQIAKDVLRKLITGKERLLVQAEEEAKAAVANATRAEEKLSQSQTLHEECLKALEASTRTLEEDERAFAEAVRKRIRNNEAVSDIKDSVCAAKRTRGDL